MNKIDASTINSRNPPSIRDATMPDENKVYSAHEEDSACLDLVAMDR